jgi:hypothetical protein
VSNERSELSRKIESLDQRMAHHNQELFDINARLQHLATVSAQYTNDTLQCAEQIEEVIRAKERAHEMRAQVADSIEAVRLRTSYINAEITVMEQNNHLPPPVEMVAQNTQTDLIPRRQLRPGRPKDATPDTKKPQLALPPKEETVFERVRREYALTAGQPVPDAIVVSSYEELAQFKRVLDGQERELRVNQEQIIEVEDGTCDIEKTPGDWLRIFASKIVHNAIEAALRKMPHAERESQTMQDPLTGHLSVQEVIIRKKVSRFVSLMKMDYSQRPPKSIVWLLPVVHAVYTEQSVANRSSFEHGREFVPFPVTVFEFGQRRFGVTFLRDQFLWDIQNTSHSLSQISTEVAMFADFLDEAYNEEQLAFFLSCRSDCLRVGYPVTVRTRDEVDTYEEHFLSLDQIEELLRLWWKDRYERKFFLTMVDFSVARPAARLDATKRYLAMHDLLYELVREYAADCVTRLTDLLEKWRISPKMTVGAFSNLVKKLVPEISPEYCNEIYRSTLAKRRAKKGISVQKFITAFYTGSVLAKLSTRHPQGQNPEILAEVEIAWRQHSVGYQKILDFFRVQFARQPDDLIMKGLYDDSMRLQGMLVHALSVQDGKNACLHFYQLIFTLDLLIDSTDKLQPHDQETGIRFIETCLRENWLDAFAAEAR